MSIIRVVAKPPEMTIWPLLVIVLLGLWGVFSPSASAENKGLLWHVEKDGHRSYLFGSVHFADSSFYPLAPAVMKAYRQSEVLVVEVDESTVPPDRQQALLRQHGFYPEGKTLHDYFKPKTVSVIESLLREFDVPLSHVQNYRPGMLAISLTAMQAGKLGFTAEQGIDRYFMTKARYKKPIRQIETFEFQMALLAKLPADDQTIYDSFSDMKDYPSMWMDTMKAWKTGNAQAIYDIAIGSTLQDYPRLKPFFDILFFDRHPKMTDTAASCIAQQEICFIVVGAGHLVGARGVVAELKQRGFSVYKYD